MAAFLIAGITGIPYSKVIAVAVVPAVFYVLSCAFYVQFQAAKMQVTAEKESVDYRELILRSPLFLGSLIVIILLFAMGKTALLVIDVQKGLDDPSLGNRNNPEAEGNIALLLAECPVETAQHRLQ